MLQGVGLGDVGYLVHGFQTEGTARSREQNLLNFVVALAHDALENGRVLAVDGQDGCVIFVGQLANQFTGYDQRLLVGQANLLAGLDGMNGGRESGKSHHGGEYHVDRLCLYYFVECLLSGIDFHIGVGQCFFQLFVVGLVGNDDCRRMKLACLLGKQFPSAVGRQRIGLVAVAVFTDDVERLCADASGGA